MSDTETHTSGTPYTWGTATFAWADPEMGKPWSDVAPWDILNVTDESLTAAPALSNSVTMHTFAEAFAVAHASMRSITEVSKQDLSASETVQHFAVWINLIQESYAIAEAFSNRPQPGAHAETLTVAELRAATLTHLDAVAVALAEVQSGVANFLRDNAEAVAVAAARTVEMTHLSAEDLDVLDRLIRHANAVLYDLLVSNEAYTEAELIALADNIMPLGYDALRPLIPGDYTYQKAIVGIQVTAPVVASRAGVGSLKLHVDVPDVQDRGQVVIAADGDTGTVTFGKTFHVVPEIKVEIIGGTTPSKFQLETAVTKTGFTFSLRDLTNLTSKVAGTISWQALAY